MIDFRYAFRTLMRSPGFTIVAVLALALGIGANSALFSVVNALLLRPLPFSNPDRLVLLWCGKSDQGESRRPASFLDYRDIRDQSHAFESMAAFFAYANTSFNLTAGDEPERIQAAYASADLFRTLGVTPLLGRTYLPEEDRHGGARVVVLGHELWRRRFASDPSFVGKMVSLDGEGYTVVGIMPAGFNFPRFPRDAEAWVPLGLDPRYGRTFSRGTRYLTIVARLRAGVAPEQAQAEVDTLAARMQHDNPGPDTGLALRVVLLQAQVTGDLRPALLILLGAAGIVLLIACANVANLLLVRAASRRKEIAIRAALGAGRARITAQLLTESVVLSLLGGAAGLLFALWGTDLLAFIPYNTPEFLSPYKISPDQIGIDPPVLAFTFALSLLTGVVFGLVPALQSSAADLHETLKEGGARPGGAARGRRARRALVIAELALSLVLLIGATLLIRSFARLQEVPLGFNATHVLTAGLSLPAAKYPTDTQVSSFSDQLLTRLRAVPGVEWAGAARELPMGGVDENTGVFVEGRDPGADGRKPMVCPHIVSPDYFRTLEIGMRGGRAFGAQDSAGSQRVAIVNETLAGRLWPAEDPIGKRLALDYEAMRFFPDRSPQLDLAAGMRVVVGVVRDIRHQGLDSESVPEMYLPLAQYASRELKVVIRASSDPSALAAAVRQEVLSLDRDQPVSDLRSMEAILSDSVARPRFNFILMALFGGVALVLAAVGVYGVVSYSVTQRTHEIGVRMALGARGADVLRMVLREGTLLVLSGVTLGMVAALGLTRLMSGLLFGVSPKDSTTFVGVPLLLGGVAFLASYIPAWRAARVDPVVALRAE